jgi:ribosomal-protein-alanine N-acetyltransferase
MKAPEEIQTSRLLLCRPCSGDAVEIFRRYASDPDVTRFLSWPRHQSVAETEAFLEFSDRSWEEWPAGPYLIRARDSGQLLGGTGFAFTAPDEAVTGYVLAKDAWGKRYATEALQAIIRAAPSIGVKRLTAQCHPQHERSWRILEKCGFVRDAAGPVPTNFPNLDQGMPHEALCYELLLERGVRE